MKNLSSFLDVRQVFDQCIAMQGGIYRLTSREAALAWRHRAYRFRDLAKAQGDNAYATITLHLSQEDPTAIMIKTNQYAGTLTALDGASPEDPLLAEARELLKSMGDFNVL